MLSENARCNGYDTFIDLIWILGQLRDCAENLMRIGEWNYSLERKRETIESFFESMKQRADGTRVRVWDTDTLRGRMFVQFVALCYYEYLRAMRSGT
jgi:hypothetical protein